VKFLLDTHLLLWIAGYPERLSEDLLNELTEPANEFVFSAANLWEIAIKSALGREDFRVNPRVLRQGLLDNGYVELPITSEPAVSIDALPLLHKDPFDRILLAQALTEGVTLLTADELLAGYSGLVRKV
jgi:PIN domain nuclease of toxin-antitoxin system